MSAPTGTGAPVTAQEQTDLAPEETLHSANAGVVVLREAQLEGRHRAAGRRLSHGIARRINERHRGSVTVLLYEEAFGVQDRVHWLVHARSLDDYDELARTMRDDGALREIATGEEARAADGGWAAMFVAGSVRETLLIPQSWGMYGTEDTALGEVAVRGGRFTVLPARHQTTVPAGRILHSANAGLVAHRSAQPRYRFRGEARAFAREVAESINVRQVGETAVFVYEEAFGAADRIHWLIHMRSLSSYYPLIDMHIQMDDEVRDIYVRRRFADERGEGAWSELFVEGSMRDVALAPLYWGVLG